MTKEEIAIAAQKEFAHQIEIGSKAPLSVQEGFIKGAEWMLEQCEAWLRKSGRGQLIGSLNRYLENNESKS